MMRRDPEVEALRERIVELGKALLAVRHVLDAENEPSIESGWAKANEIINEALESIRGV